MAPSASASSSSNTANNQWAQLSFVEVLEDLSSRFIVNLPKEELQSIQRICFQVEQAHWFYEDFLRPLNTSLPSLNLRKFSIYVLQTASLSVPLIRRYVSSSTSESQAANGSAQVQDLQTLGAASYGLEAAFDEFLKYKTRVPVCGVILVSEDWKSCLLVKGWKSSAAWGFPKGKINQSESHRDCAVRETYEETGFDCSHLLPPDSPHWFELNVREQKMRLYIVPGVPKDTVFETQTRKEISKIAWFQMSDLPTWKQAQATGGGGLASANAGAKFYLVTPFVGKLKQWVKDNKKKASRADGAAKEDSVRVSQTADQSSDQTNAANAATQQQGPLFGDPASAWPLGQPTAPPPPPQQIAPPQAGPPRDDSAMLLSMLQGGMKINGDTHTTSSAQQANLTTAARDSPLPAPQAQKASPQTLKLLEMLSPGTPQAGSGHSPAASDPEASRALKRDALLAQLMGGGSSGTVARVEDSVDSHNAPLQGAPPPHPQHNDQAKLLGLLQSSGPTASTALPHAPKPTSDQNMLLGLLQPRGGQQPPFTQHLPPQHAHLAYPQDPSHEAYPASYAGQPPPMLAPGPHNGVITGQHGFAASPLLPHQTRSGDQGRSDLLAMLNAGPTAPSRHPEAPPHALSPFVHQQPHQHQHQQYMSPPFPAHGHGPPPPPPGPPYGYTPPQHFPTGPPRFGHQ